MPFYLFTGSLCNHRRTWSEPNLQRWLTIQLPHLLRCKWQYLAVTMVSVVLLIAHNKHLNKT